MIPYIHVPSFHLGPAKIEPFGALVALGIFVAAGIASRAARADRRSLRPLEDFVPWGIAAGVVGAHLVHLFCYHPEELALSPWQLFKVWDGLSSTGGVLGGMLAAAVVFPLRRARFGDYADALALGMAPGWGIARLGCFAAHDHPGVHSDFFLAVAFPDGPRHDLGLDDALALFAITALIFVLRRRKVLQGRLLGVLALCYATSRFSLDFLRARDLSYVDARYLGLTPAQFACIALFTYGAYQVARGLRASSPRDAEAPAESPMGATDRPAA